MDWHHQAITNEVVTRKTRYKDPQISEGAGRTFIPVERKAPKRVCASLLMSQRTY